MGGERGVRGGREGGLIGGRERERGARGEEKGKMADFRCMQEFILSYQLDISALTGRNNLPLNVPPPF